MNTCFALAAHWLRPSPIALETTTISSIGFSDHESSHASQGTWLWPTGPTTTSASDVVTTAKQHSTEVFPLRFGPSLNSPAKRLQNPSPRDDGAIIQ